VGRRCEPMEGRGARLSPRTASCRLSPAYPNAYLQADSALLVAKIVHPINLFWEYPTDFPFSPLLFPALDNAA
jgi:hypothetical protein